MNAATTTTTHQRAPAPRRANRFQATMALTALLLAQASPAVLANEDPGLPQGLMDPLVGTWNVLVDIYDCNTGTPIATGAQALALFNADGTRHETNATNPALRSPGYGNWQRVKRNEYEFALKFYRFDPSGTNIGSTVIRQELFLSEDGTIYYSEGPAEFLNTAGIKLFEACASATATRFD